MRDFFLGFRDEFLVSGGQADSLWMGGAAYMCLGTAPKSLRDLMVPPASIQI